MTTPKPARTWTWPTQLGRWFLVGTACYFLVQAAWPVLHGSSAWAFREWPNNGLSRAMQVVQSLLYVALAAGWLVKGSRLSQAQRLRFSGFLFAMMLQCFIVGVLVGGLTLFWAYMVLHSDVRKACDA